MSEKLTDEVFRSIWEEKGAFHPAPIYYARAVARAALEQAKQLALDEPRVFEPEAPDPQHRIAAKIQALIDEVSK